MKKFLFLISALLIIGTLGSCGGSASTTGNSTTAPTATPEPTPEVKTYKSGQYKVGSDLDAGEYVLISNTMAYFEIASDSTGKLESIVANDNFVNRSIISVSDGQYFKLDSGTMYAFLDAPAVIIEDEKLPEGMYKVGVDIDAGEYKVVPDGTGYIEVSSDSSHMLDSIITNDILSGEQYITIEDGQYIKLSGAYLIVK